MASAISFSGIASGIDTDALIKATSDATRATREKPSQTKVTELTDTNTSLTELKKRLSEITTSLSKIGTIAGGAIQHQGTSTDDTTVSATASQQASNGSYIISRVDALAKNATFAFSNVFTSTDQTFTDAGLTPGTTTVLIGTGTDQQTITIDSTQSDADSIAEWVTKFNNSTTKAVASIVKFADNDYRVLVTSLNTGTAQGQLAVSSAGPFTDPTGSIDSATNANFTVTGLGAISRTTNTVSDVIPGVTIGLNKVNTTTSTTLSVSADVGATTAKVQDFIDRYNKLVQYLADQNKIERQENGKNVTNTFSPLSTTRIDENAVTAIRTAISSAVYNVDSNGDGDNENAIRTLADLGIKTNRDGTLTFDTAVFASALSKEPTSANQLLVNFADGLSSFATGTLNEFTKFNGIIDTAITGNNTRISSLNDAIARAEADILKTEENLRARYARLEATLGQLQSQQSTLTSALAGLNK